MKKMIIAVFTASAVFIACKKDPKTTPPPTTDPKDTSTVDTNKAASRFEALTTDKWRISSVYMMDTANKDTIFEYYTGMKECEKDNFIFFNKDGSITSDEGATKCDPSVAQVTTDGSWILNSDTTKFTIKSSTILPISGDLSARIVSLDKNNFKIAKDTTIIISPYPPLKGIVYAGFTKVK